MVKFTVGNEVIRRLQEDERQLRLKIASWIRSELAIKNRTQLDLAGFLGIQPSQLTRLMQGKRGLDVWELERIESFFGSKALDKVELVGYVGEAVWRDQPIEISTVSQFEHYGVPVSKQLAFRVDRPTIDQTILGDDIIYVAPIQSHLARPNQILLIRRERSEDLHQYTLCRCGTGGTALQPMYQHNSPAEREIEVGVVFGLVRQLALGLVTI